MNSITSFSSDFVLQDATQPNTGTAQTQSRNAVIKVFNKSTKKDLMSQSLIFIELKKVNAMSCSSLANECDDSKGLTCQLVSGVRKCLCVKLNR